MDYYVEIEDENICMICNEDHGFANIFVESLEGEGVLLHEALEFITCLKVETNDNMSKSLCVDCNGRLLEAYRFKNQALESFRALKDICTPIEITFTDGDEIELESSVVGTNESIVEVSNAIIESASKPEVDMTTDAVTFLIEHHLNNITKENPLEETECQPNKGITTSSSPRGKVKHECKICNRSFPKKSNLTDHIRLHNNDKRFVCSYCDKSFVQVANFRMHERIHTKERPFQCLICSKSYTQSSTLKVHMRSHTQERNYICTTCSKAFTNSTDLKKHMRMHDPSMRFKCEFCGKSFVQKVNMKVHIRRNHTKEVSS